MLHFSVQYCMKALHPMVFCEQEGLFCGPHRRQQKHFLMFPKILFRDVSHLNSVMKLCWPRNCGTLNFKTHCFSRSAFSSLVQCLIFCHLFQILSKPLLPGTFSFPINLICRNFNVSTEQKQTFYLIQIVGVFSSSQTLQSHELLFCRQWKKNPAYEERNWILY